MLIDSIIVINTTQRIAYTTELHSSIIRGITITLVSELTKPLQWTVEKSLGADFRLTLHHIATPSPRHGFVFPPPRFELVSHIFGAYEAVASGRWICMIAVIASLYSSSNACLCLFVVRCRVFPLCATSSRS